MTTRAVRRFVCRVLIGVLLSTQVALAAYACTGMPGSMARVAGAIALADATLGGGPDVGMGADDMDPGLANLCAGHCQYGHQATDKKPAPDVPVALLTSLYALAPVDRGTSAAGLLAPRGLLAVPDPPHAILHCCFRD